VNPGVRIEVIGRPMTDCSMTDQALDSANGIGDRTIVVKFQQHDRPTKAKAMKRSRSPRRPSARKKSGSPVG
jgi:hypothetical protein